MRDRPRQISMAWGKSRFVCSLEGFPEAEPLAFRYRLGYTRAWANQHERLSCFQEFRA